MTVKELIELLSKLEEPEAEVFTRAGEVFKVSKEEGESAAEPCYVVID